MRSIRDVLIVISLALVTTHPMTHPGDAGAGASCLLSVAASQALGSSVTALSTLPRVKTASPNKCPDIPWLWWPIYIKHCIVWPGSFIDTEHMSSCHDVTWKQSWDQTWQLSSARKHHQTEGGRWDKSIQWFNMSTVISDARLLFRCFYH